MANFDKTLNLGIKLPFKFVLGQLFMPFLMSYVLTLYSQYFIGSALLKGIRRRILNALCVCIESHQCIMFIFVS